MIGVLIPEKMLSEFKFVQRGLGPERGPGEDAYDVDREELFHVDQERREVVRRLPEFEHFGGFSIPSSLANMAVLRSNLDIVMRRSNNTPAQNGIPPYRAEAPGPFPYAPTPS
uniref:Uncharacterized protein n=1 Tax=Sphaerodactylus townsendi TaxID=933632 RepID=A0ACB8EF83_9SAUR